MRDLALKRHNDWKKAIRKRNICLHEYGWEYYDNLHQYSKNKIHCSCPICSSKTNTKMNKSKGPMDPNRRFHRAVVPTVTNSRCGKKNYKISDMKKIQELNSSLEDYYKGEYLYEAV